MSYFDDNEDFIVYGSRRGYRPQEPREVECKRCGKSGLRWSEESTGWVLMERGFKVHRCDMTKLAIDDFDVIK